MILNKTKTYLIGPWENAISQDWRQEIHPRLEKLNITIFTPFNKPFMNSFDEGPETKELIYASIKAKDFNLVRNHMKAVRAFDLRMVDLSDFVIAYINPKIPSWGSADEIYTALRSRKPTFLIIEGGIEKCPLWLFASIPPKFIFNSVDNLMTYLENVNSGREPLDTKYWRLLRPEFR